MNVAVIGAGVVGCLTALMLKRSGAKVSLFSAARPDSVDTCSSAAGGMLSPIAEAIYGNQVIADAGWDSVKRWKDLLETFEKAPMFGHDGSVLWAASHHRVEIREWAQRLAQKFPDKPWELLPASSSRSLGPDFGDSDVDTIVLKNEGFVDTRAVLIGLSKALDKEGVRCLYGLRIDLLLEGLNDLDGDCPEFDMIIDCRGLAAKQIWPGLRGVRGEALLVHAPEVSLKRPIRVLHPRYPVYVVPRSHHYYYIGATVVESESLHTISVQSLLELLTGLYQFHSGFRYAHVVENIVQVRPALDDHEPRIETSPRLIRVNGLFRHGFLLGPIVAKSVVDIVYGRSVEPKVKCWVTPQAVSQACG
jgi:glycine oxidase